MVHTHPISVLPTTPLGRVATWLLAIHVLLMLSWRLLGPLGGFPGLVVGLATGITAVVAITRRHEHALLVWVAILPGVFVVLFVALELLVGHS